MEEQMQNNETTVLELKQLLKMEGFGASIIDTSVEKEYGLDIQRH